MYAKTVLGLGTWSISGTQYQPKTTLYCLSIVTWNYLSVIVIVAWRGLHSSHLWDPIFSLSNLQKCHFKAEFFLMSDASFAVQLKVLEIILCSISTRGETMHLKRDEHARRPGGLFVALAKIKCHTCDNCVEWDTKSSQWGYGYPNCPRRELKATFIGRV